MLFKNNMLLFIVDYYSKFPTVKKAESLSADHLISAAKIMYAVVEHPRKIVSGASMNFISDKFKHTNRQLAKEQAITLLYYHNSS